MDKKYFLKTNNINKNSYRNDCGSNLDIKVIKSAIKNLKNYRINEQNTPIILHPHQLEFLNEYIFTDKET